MSQEAVEAPELAPKAAELVAHQLRRRIVLGELPEGSLLPSEVELVAQLGVSRPTLRQALRILESELLVTVQRGRNGGTRIERPSVAVAMRYLGNLLQYRGVTLADVHTARVLLEPEAVSRLAKSITPKQVAELRALHEQADLNDAESYRVSGHQFHAAIVAMLGNPVLTLFSQIVQRLLDAPNERYDRQRRARGVPSRAPQMLHDHEHLIELLEAGAAKAAAAAWRTHLEDVYSILQETVDTDAVLEVSV